MKLESVSDEELIALCDALLEEAQRRGWEITVVTSDKDDGAFAFARPPKK